MKLIDKEALVAEIINLKVKHQCDWNCAIDKVLEHIDESEVQKMDLDSNIKEYLTDHFNVYEDGILQSKKSKNPLNTYDIIKVAKYFFELGLNIRKGK